jgi:peptide/nickel transport system substrate-binding protein
MGAHYENPYVEELMLLSRGHEDVTVRTELNIDIQKVLSIDVPYIPLWQSKQFCVTQPYISGVVLEPSQIFRYYLLEIEQ